MQSGDIGKQMWRDKVICPRKRCECEHTRCTAHKPAALSSATALQAACGLAFHAGSQHQLQAQLGQLGMGNCAGRTHLLFTIFRLLFLGVSNELWDELGSKWLSTTEYTKPV